MDVLGYTDMVKRAEREGRQDAFLAQVHEALSKGRDWLCCHDFGTRLIGERDPHAMKAFTDNIVIGWPLGGLSRREDGESELGDAFRRLADFQLEMTNAGFFVRGAVALGDAYMDDIAVFGGGFMEAYEAESRLARDPRLILTPSATEAVRKHLGYYGRLEFAPQYRYLYKDIDGQWFLSYLESILFGVHQELQGPMYHELERHKNSVEARLLEFRSEPRIWSKYAWVANYHNYFCDQNPEHFNDTHKIEREIADTRPSRIAADGS
jgi:hypothetical protein